MAAGSRRSKPTGRRDEASLRPDLWTSSARSCGHARFEARRIPDGRFASGFSKPDFRRKGLPSASELRSVNELLSSAAMAPSDDELALTATLPGGAPVAVPPSARATLGRFRLE